MEFKIWLNEVAEPKKPSNKISNKSVIKNGGTWKEKKVKEYYFKTNLGNEVKVHFEDVGDNTYDVMFYVNDTQYDDASKSDQSRMDTDIISNVLWLIKQKANTLKIKQLTFTAQTGEGDERIIRGLNIDEYKTKALKELDIIKNMIFNYVTQMIKPKSDIYLKLKRPIPPDYPDLDKDRWLKNISRLENEIYSDDPDLFSTINWMIQESPNLQKLGIDSQNFQTSMNDLMNAIQSNSTQGYRRVKNRRESLWTKLVNKYFSDWAVEKYGTKFHLTKLSD